MLHAIKNFVVREEGVTVVEYAVALAMVAAGAIIGLGALGVAARDFFQQGGDTLATNNLDLSAP